MPKTTTAFGTPPAPDLMLARQQRVATSAVRRADPDAAVGVMLAWVEILSKPTLNQVNAKLAAAEAVNGNLRRDVARLRQELRERSGGTMTGWDFPL